MALYTAPLGTNWAPRTPKERALRLAYLKAHRNRRANPEKLYEIASEAEKQGIDISGSLTENSQQNTRAYNQAVASAAQEQAMAPVRQRNAVRDQLKRDAWEASKKGMSLSEYRSRAVGLGADPAQADRWISGLEKNAPKQPAGAQGAAGSTGPTGPTGPAGALGFPSLKNPMLTGGAPDFPALKNPMLTSTGDKMAEQLATAKSSVFGADEKAPGVVSASPAPAASTASPSRGRLLASGRAREAPPVAVEWQGPPAPEVPPGATRKQVGVGKGGVPIYENVPDADIAAADASNRETSRQAAQMSRDRQARIDRILRTPGGADMVRRQDRIAASLAPGEAAARKTVEETAAELEQSDLYAGERRAPSGLKEDTERDAKNKAARTKVAADLLRRRRMAAEQARRYAYNM